MTKAEKDVKEAFEGLDYVISPAGEKLATVDIKGRKIPLYFTLADVEAMTAEVGPVTEVQDALGKNFLSPQHVQRVISMIRILGNSGLIEMGMEPDLTDEWIGRRMKMTDVSTDLMTRLMVAFYGAMGMETETAADRDRTVDVTLREIEKKKEPGS